MSLVHVVNHSIEGRDLYYDSQDYARFVHDMYEFNRPAAANNTTRHYTKPKMNDIRCRSFVERPHVQLVYVHAWCLMRDHYHLLLSDATENGVHDFMRKVNIGYAKFHNEKHHRKGFVFRGKTKMVPVTEQGHFLHVFNYVHFNPLDYLPGAESWRTYSINDAREAYEHLQAYKWSSFQDYIGVRNFPSIIDRELYDEVYPNYAKLVRTQLQDLGEHVLPGKEWWGE